MARPKSDGPKRVTRRLSDGSVWVYLYDRSTGESVGKHRIDDDGTDGTIPGSMAALIADYKASSHFQRLAPNTRSTYAAKLAFLVETIGDTQIHTITPADIQTLKEDLHDRPSLANATMAMLSILFNYAVRTQRAKHNPAAKPGKLPLAARTTIWSAEAEKAYVDQLRPALRLAFYLMLYTLQRFSDVLSLTTDNVMERDGRLWVVLTQQKTGALVGIPVHMTLEPHLRARLAQRITYTAMENGQKREIECRHLVTSPTGRPWPRRNASRAWDTDIAAANKDLRAAMREAGRSAADIEAEIGRMKATRHDLRRTGAVRLAERNATAPQIAHIAGWEIDYTQRILDTYLPRRSEIALAGIEAWEARPDPKVVRLPDRPNPGITQGPNTSGFQKTNRKTGNGIGRKGNE